MQQGSSLLKAQRACCNAAQLCFAFTQAYPAACSFLVLFCNPMHLLVVMTALVGAQADSARSRLGLGPGLRLAHFQFSARGVLHASNWEVHRAPALMLTQLEASSAEVQASMLLSIISSACTPMNCPSYEPYCAGNIPPQLITNANKAHHVMS